MKHLKLLLVGLLLPALFLVSCKKDNDDTESVTYKEPAAASMTEVVKIPEGLQAKAEAGTDIGATVAVMYMEWANAFSSFGSSFVIPEGATKTGKKDGTLVYHWTYEGNSFWMTYEELPDKYIWTYDWQVSGQDRFTYISAEEAKDGKSGKWTIYDPQSTSDYVWTYNWTINSSNTYHAVLEWNNESEEASFDILANADNSGSFKYYVTNVLQAEINWNADGSGTYWIDADGMSLEGSWTAK